MRFYRIELYKPQQRGVISNDRGQLYVPPSLPQMAQERCSWTSFVTGGSQATAAAGGFGGSGRNIPGALNVELDVSVTTDAIPDSANAWLRIWGIAKEEISNPNDFWGGQIVVYGGFRKGLPLAKPQQSQAPIFGGLILQSYVNWKGTEITLEFSFSAGSFVATEQQPGNFVLNWTEKTKLADAIKATLASAISGGNNATVNISDQLVQDAPQWGFWPSLGQFGEAIKKISLQKKFQGIPTTDGSTYSGVNLGIDPAGGFITVTDNSQNSQNSPLPGSGVQSTTVGPPSGTPNVLPTVTVTASPDPVVSAKRILFEDIIGQPVWKDTNLIQITCPMRSDISIADLVQLPESLAAITQIPRSALPNQFTNVRNKLAFNGPFLVQAIRHVGNFRSADKDAWITVFDLVMTGATTAWDPVLAPGTNPVIPYGYPR